jgi:hypothetical protein
MIELKMVTFVLHEGKIIDKRERPIQLKAASALPAPAVHSFAAYPSPIDGRPITSSRQRERDLHNSGSYDKRDEPASYKKAKHARREWQQRTAAKPPRYS